jgi:Skp family chaperone for outer membrane proteins
MKPIKWLLLLLAVSGTLFITACESESATEQAAEDVEQAGEDMADAFRSEREELRADIEDMQEDINDKIADLESNLENASDEAAEEIKEQIEQLESWNTTLDDRLNRLGENVEDGWQDFRTDVESTLTEIEQGWEETFEGEG